MKTLKHILFAGILGSSGLASANAFNVNEHDARVTGRGGATAASNTTPSSIVFNPGGIAVAEGTNILINGSIYIAEGSYEPPGSNQISTDSPPSVVPSLYVTSRIHELLAIGIGLHLPFGLAVSWPEDHPQADVIQDQSLRTYFITPSVGINLNKYVPGLSIGGGVDIVPATVELEQALLFGDARGRAHLGGDGLGIGGRVGVMYNPEALRQLKLGVMWRSDIDIEFTGNGDFDIDAPFRSQLPPDGAISTEITLPQSVWGGVGYSVTPELDLEYNAVWINWSKFDELRIQLPAGAETVSPQDYKNTVSHRLGAEYRFPRQNFAVRAGFIYDPTPIPARTLSARLPDIDRKNITLGGSKWFGNYGAHLGFLWVTPGHRDTTDDMPISPQIAANYGVQAFVVSLTLTGSFGAGGTPDPTGSGEIARR